jgi:hypothetical protein
MSADSRNMKEKNESKRDFTTIDITESDRTKLFLILYPR